MHVQYMCSYTDTASTDTPCAEDDRVDIPYQDSFIWPKSIPGELTPPPLESCCRDRDQRQLDQPRTTARPLQLRSGAILFFLCLDLEHTPKDLAADTLGYLVNESHATP